MIVRRIPEDTRGCIDQLGVDLAHGNLALRQYEEYRQANPASEEGHALIDELAYALREVSSTSTSLVGSLMDD